TYTAVLGAGDGQLVARRTVYPTFGGQSATQVAIRSTALEDLYVVLADGTTPGQVTLVAFVNPLVSWIWAGAALLIVGTLLGSWPGGGREPARLRLPASLPAPAGGAECRVSWTRCLRSWRARP